MGGNKNPSIFDCMRNPFDQRQWLACKRAEHFLEVEKVHTDRALRQIGGPNVLLLGNLIDHALLLELDFPQLVWVTQDTNSQDTEKNSAAKNNVNYSLAADSAFLPFEEGSFSSVILPHALEAHELPHQVLREAHRVLQPEGHLLLTCFNPISLLGLQRLMRQKSVPVGQYYGVSRVTDWLSLLGFEVVGSAMYHYAPLCKNELLRKRLAFINAVGDRWLPMVGGSYLITARKRNAGLRIIEKNRFARAKQLRLSSASMSSANNGK